MMDADAAGQKAIRRASELLESTGLNVRVVLIPDGKDPDEFVRRHGKDAFLKLVENATPLLDYKIQYVLAHREHITVSGKIAAVNEILQDLAGIEDTVARGEYAVKISSALLLDEDLVKRQWSKIEHNAAQARKKSSSKNPARTSVQNLPSENQLIRQSGSTIIREAWYESEALAFALERVPKEIFTKLHQEIISYLEKCQAEERRPDDVSAARELSAEAAAELSRILAGVVFQSQENERKAFDDSLKFLRHAYLKALHGRLIKEAEEYFKSGDEAASQEKMLETLRIKKEMDEL